MSERTETPAVRDDRYFVKDTKSVAVTVTTELFGKVEAIKAELVDISTGGARLRSREPVPTKEIVGLELTMKRPRRKIAVSGEVCWMVPATGDCWWIGCLFQPSLPDETLQQFAKGGVLDRRQSNRESVAIATTAKWELSSDSSSAQIIDFSQGGFRLRCGERGKPGERLLLQFRNHDGQEIFVRAKAQWQVEDGEAFTIGCAFLDPEDFTVFCGLKECADSFGANVFSMWQWLSGS